MQPSHRIQQTDDPCIVAMQSMLKDAPADTISLSQGIVFWTPPEAALKRAADAVTLPHTSQYCADAGLPELRAALQAKISTENNLSNSSVMVTQGANQAFVNVVLSLCDQDQDQVVLFPPYYFNHKMALQMTIRPENIVLGERDEDMAPSVEWLQQILTTSETNIKMIVITNPDNPTGTVATKDMLEEMARLCGKHNIWLVLDNTYEYFVYDTDARPFHCIEAPHVLNIFSFSKAYGMMGWRQGYLSYIDAQIDATGSEWSLEAQLLKCQDTIPICPTIISQHVALGALQDAGSSWVRSKLKDVVQNQKLLRSVLVDVVGESNVWGGQGAIYLFARLPSGMDDNEIVKTLALVHKVVIIPGTACGAPGHVRVSYANLVPEKCVDAAERLRSGLQQILQGN